MLPKLTSSILYLPTECLRSQVVRIRQLVVMLHWLIFMHQGCIHAMIAGHLPSERRYKEQGILLEICLLDFQSRGWLADVLGTQTVN